MFTDYYPMYKAAAEAVKRVDESLQIGGPASAFSHYVEHLTQYCQQDGTPLDFVSTHAYPTTGIAFFFDSIDTSARRQICFGVKIFGVIFYCFRCLYRQNPITILVYSQLHDRAAPLYQTYSTKKFQKVGMNLTTPL